jgi:hypothetical protein
MEEYIMNCFFLFVLFLILNILDILVGFLVVSFINCSALGGAVILPFRKKPAFKWILSAFIGLGMRNIYF